MNRFFFIGLSIAIVAFLTSNFLLLFGEKSIISKELYVSEYEQAYTHTYTETLPKEALTAPQDTMEIYVQDHEALEQWLVKEGDAVTAGAELARLNESESEDQRAIWQSEQSALQAERSEVQSTLQELTQARASQDSSVSENSNNSSSYPGFGEDMEQELRMDVNVSVGVEVPEDGSYASGIAQAQQRLAAIDSELAVVEAQLAQSQENPALISPVEGTVASINRDTEPLSIEIYNNEREFVTYLLEDEWHEVEQADRVFIQAPGIEGAIPGTVRSVSEIPAEESKWFEAYRELGRIEQNNPIAFYEVRIAPETPMQDTMPYGSNVNAEITLDEAQDAIALRDGWVYDDDNTTGTAYTLNIDGRPNAVPVEIAFTQQGRVVLASGMEAGNITINEEQLHDYPGRPKLFMPFPIRTPDFNYAKNTEWRAYIEYLLAR
ncbi:efflux RND transporter periplasmic adaptor subunit [Planococcus citreus]|uniref:HlyD family secretion protein n=1 Tax=Planococcus citreus TaxID=1373 RepID=A0A497YIE4_9BACL|nr:efflux RND transporter periplasmic adaptor subunit [Planococcus citreus]RLJ90807.1 HlyD family secretion protein [Planococcus citreus]